MSVWVGLAWVSTGLWNCDLCIIRIRLSCCSSWEFKDARFHCSGDDLKWVIRRDWNSENAAVGEMLIANQRQLFTGRTLLLGLWSNHLSTRGDVALTQRQRKRNYLWDFFFFCQQSLVKVPLFTSLLYLWLIPCVLSHSAVTDWDLSNTSLGSTFLLPSLSGVDAPSSVLPASVTPKHVSPFFFF